MSSIMVNKAVIAILLIVVLTMAGIAALIGLVLGPQFASDEATGTATDGGTNGGGGGGGSSATTTTTTAANTTATVTTTTGPPTGTTTTDGSSDGDGDTASQPTTTDQQVTTIQPTTTTDTGPDPIYPGFFNETRIEELVVEKVNERKNRDYTDSDSVARRVARMARNHSAAMAAEGEVVHKIDGNNTVARYKDNDLYEVCQWPTDEQAIRRPGYPGSKNNFEVIAGDIYAGQSYQQDGETRFNGNESEVADAIVDYWLSRSTYNQRLSYDNARRLGVGVNITESGEVYATGNLC
jgi:hypothetical protein